MNEWLNNWGPLFCIVLFLAGIGTLAWAIMDTNARVTKIQEMFETFITLAREYAEEEEKEE